MGLLWGVVWLMFSNVDNCYKWFNSSSFFWWKNELNPLHTVFKNKDLQYKSIYV